MSDLIVQLYTYLLSISGGLILDPNHTCPLIFANPLNNIVLILQYNLLHILAGLPYILDGEIQDHFRIFVRNLNAKFNT